MPSRRAFDRCVTAAAERCYLFLGIAAPWAETCTDVGTGTYDMLDRLARW